MSNRFIATFSAVATLVALLPAMALAADLSTPAMVAATTSDATTADNTSSAKSCSGAKACGAKHAHKRHTAFGPIEQSLSADQKQQISAIRDQLKTDNKPLFEKVKSLRDQLSANPQPSNADELQNQLTSAREQLRSSMKAGHAKMMAVLTDDQKAELAKARQERKQLREQKDKQSDAAPVAPSNDSAATTMPQTE